MDRATRRICVEAFRWECVRVYVSDEYISEREIYLMLHCKACVARADFFFLFSFVFNLFSLYCFSFSLFWSAHGHRFACSRITQHFIYNVPCMRIEKGTFYIRHSRMYHRCTCTSMHTTHFFYDFQLSRDFLAYSAFTSTFK